MRKPQLFAPENHPARSICGIKLAHNLAHKNVQNVQLKQWMLCCALNGSFIKLFSGGLRVALGLQIDHPTEDHRTVVPR